MAMTAANHDLGYFGAASAFAVPAGKHFLGRLVAYHGGATGKLTCNGAPWVSVDALNTMLGDLKPLVIKASDVITWSAGSPATRSWLTGFLYDNAALAPVHHDLGYFGAASAFVVPAGKHFVGRLVPTPGGGIGTLTCNGVAWVAVDGLNTMLGDLKPLVIKAGDVITWSAGSIATRCWLTGFLYDN